MSVITLPAAVIAWMGGMAYGQARFDLADASPVTGGAFVMPMGPPRWTMGIRSGQGLTLDVAGEWEALLLKLRGGINHLAIYDVLRPVPLGSMRGHPCLAAAIAIGDTSALLDNVIGDGKRGDWLQISTGLGTSQLVKVVEPYSSSVATPTVGSWTLGGTPGTWTLGGTPGTWTRPGAQVTVVFEPPARIAFGKWTPWVWDKPFCYYKLTSGSITWQALSGGPAIDGFSADFMEQWA